MNLYYREYGGYSERRPTLIMLHGLFGSSANWHSIARRLSDTCHVIVPDLRNHGRSPHSDTMNYPAMAEDLGQLLDEHGLDAALLVGHSMGGKMAMTFALDNPRRVEGLVVVDIAPVAYYHEFDAVFKALLGVDLEALSSRGEADTLLASHLEERGLRQYLLQSLIRVEKNWRWRMNLHSLQREMDSITAFPVSSDVSGYPGPTLFVHGTESGYVTGEHHREIRTLFPHARFRAITGAGHWVYAERPDAFYSALEGFLKARRR
ncbi:MAG: alpha/beta fold hydrolase [Gammaproteobacteria bacterium]|nr:alpha/beta fold hydrolase [Gammaproteobacteria bacterium]